MKRFAPLAAFICVLSLLAIPLWAAPAKKMGKDGEVPTAGLELAKTATQITGIAISPLLGVSVIGCYQWMQADTAQEKAALPWFANPSVWLVGFLLVGAVAVKDTMGATVPPGWKKPLDVLDATENKISGLVAAGAVVPVLVAASSKFIASSAGMPPVVEIPGLAMINLAAIDFSWLITILMVPLAIVVHLIVFIASHAINVLILLSPWGAVDAALKAGRTAVLGLVTATAWIDPVVGATISGVIILFAWLISGWAFRLTIFGTIFCWEFFTRRRKRFSVLADGNKVFLGRRVDGAPIRTYGRLYQSGDGALTFRYRPWLMLPEKQVTIPRTGLCVGCGLFYSEVLGHNEKSDRVDTLLLLPPRYLEHEELFARTYHISGTCDIGLRRAWTWLKETLGMRAKRQPEPLLA